MAVSVRSRRIIGSRTDQISPIRAVTSRWSVVRTSTTSGVVALSAMMPSASLVEAPGYPVGDDLFLSGGRRGVIWLPCSPAGGVGLCDLHHLPTLGAALVEGAVRRGDVGERVDPVDHRHNRAGRDLFSEFDELRGPWIRTEGADATGTEDGGRGDRGDGGAGQPHGDHPAVLGEPAAVAGEVGADGVD